MSRPPAAGRGLLLRLGAATTCTVAAFALTGPVLAVLLQQRGWDSAAIGAFAMLPFLLIGLLIPVVPRIIGRLGVVRTYRVGALLELCGALACAAGDGPAAWGAGSVLLGVGAALLWNATETVLTTHAPAALRGRVMGLYQTALGAALALGPFLPALLRIDAPTALWVGVGLVAACLLLALRARSRALPPAQQAAGGMAQALRAVPWLVLLAFAGGVFEAGLNSIGAAQAASLGLDLRAATSVAGTVGVGSFLLQYPVGWAADRLPVRRVVLAAALVLGVASVAVAFAGRAHWLLWMCGWAWGGLGGALYTLAIVQVARAYEGRATAGGAAAAITGYTWGGTLGPLAAGAVLQGAGLAGLAALLAAVAALAAAAARKVG